MWVAEETDLGRAGAVEDELAEGAAGAVDDELARRVLGQLLAEGHGLAEEVEQSTAEARRAGLDAAAKATVSSTAPSPAGSDAGRS